MSAVVVEPDLADTLLAVSALTTAGFHITVADSFTEAKALLRSRQPSLVVSEIRLGDYNGLQLILHGRAVRPDMAAILTTHRWDAVLHTEAERMGGTVVMMPTTQSELLAAITRTVLRPSVESSAISEPFERRMRDRRASDVHVEFDRRSVERRTGLSGFLVSETQSRSHIL